MVPHLILIWGSFIISSTGMLYIFITCMLSLDSDAFYSSVLDFGGMSFILSGGVYIFTY